MMRIIDVLTSPWAIVPEKLFEIQEIYGTHLRGEKIDIEAVEAQLGQPLQNETDSAVRLRAEAFGLSAIGFGPQADGELVATKATLAKSARYQVLRDTAIIPIHGVAAKRMNMFTRISGGVSTQLIGADIKDALGRDDIKGILLDIDSPGGTVDGTVDLADIIFAGREAKPVIAFTDGMMASAAYWIGSAAHEIYISSGVANVGSIGVVASHVDYSENEKKWGVKTTEIYAGKYKRIASQYKPLSKEGKQSIQDHVDYIYSVFVDEVAKHRGVSPDKVLSDMADGRIFIGEQAIDVGLVDGVATFDQAIERLTVMQSEMADQKGLFALNDELRRVSL